jgi:hypothetical protein
MNICKLTQQKLLWLEQLSTDPQQAYMAARILLRTKNVIGFGNGMLMGTYQCDTIDSYYWDSQEACHTAIPIRYNFHGTDQRKYLTQATKDIVSYDTEVSCNKPIRMFLLTTGDKSKKRDTYVWNGKQLLWTNQSYITIPMLESIPNISYIHLIASKLDTSMQDNFDITSSLFATAHDFILTIAKMTNTDMVSLDEDLMADAARSTIYNVRKMVDTVIDHVYPFFSWVYKLIIGAIITVIIILILIIVLKIMNTVKHKHIKKNVHEFLNQLNETIEEATELKERAHEENIIEHTEVIETTSV